MGLVNDLLESIHFVASIEAMFLGVRAGIHPSIIYDIISNAAGSSRLQGSLCFCVFLNL
jgi:3-hydroxyisobutyrate dehydrogenase-like beta-hydroxyacid dehydrogenase